MRLARHAPRFAESVIRAMTQQINRYHPDDGVNLAQGFPDFPAPAVVKEAAREAIAADLNQYATTWGIPALRDGLARTIGEAWGQRVDPDDEITVCCGATESMLVAFMATLDPGDEVVIFAPSYETYAPDAVLCGAAPRYTTLRAPDWQIDWDELSVLITPRTRGLVLNTPHNPTGKVFSRAELERLAALCQEHDLYCYTDEIYDRLVYDGEHISIASLPGMREQTFTVGGFSKTFSVTGWRLGYVVAPPEATRLIRKIHDNVTCGAAHPLQAAGVAALALGAPYVETLRAEYRVRRDYLVPALRNLDLPCTAPAGAYYVMCNIDAWATHLDLSNDRAFSDYLVHEIGVATVPGSYFYPQGSTQGDHEVRFVFCKKLETLERAVALLEKGLRLA